MQSWYIYGIKHGFKVSVTNMYFSPEWTEWWEDSNNPVSAEDEAPGVRGRLSLGTCLSDSSDLSACTPGGRHQRSGGHLMQHDVNMWPSHGQADWRSKWTLQRFSRWHQWFFHAGSLILGNVFHLHDLAKPRCGYKMLKINYDGMHARQCCQKCSGRIQRRAEKSISI